MERERGGGKVGGAPTGGRELRERKCAHSPLSLPLSPLRATNWAVLSTMARMSGGGWMTPRARVCVSTVSSCFGGRTPPPPPPTALAPCPGTSATAPVSMGSAPGMVRSAAVCCCECAWAERERGVPGVGSPKVPPAPGDASVRRARRSGPPSRVIIQEKPTAHTRPRHTHTTHAHKHTHTHTYAHTTRTRTHPHAHTRAKRRSDLAVEERP